MKCQTWKCKNYELWDSSYEDECGYHEHIVEFCHHCKDRFHCADCENWDIYEDHECNWHFDPIKE